MKSPPDMGPPPPPPPRVEPDNKLPDVDPMPLAPIELSALPLSPPPERAAFFRLGGFPTLPPEPLELLLLRPPSIAAAPEVPLESVLELVEEEPVVEEVLVEALPDVELEDALEL